MMLYLYDGMLKGKVVIYKMLLQINNLFWHLLTMEMNAILCVIIILLGYIILTLSMQEQYFNTKSYNPFYIHQYL
jgi:hypothetical protein